MLMMQGGFESYWVFYGITWTNLGVLVEERQRLADAVKQHQSQQRNSVPAQPEGK